MCNIKDILKTHLIENGFDGLYNIDTSCACSIDNLLFRCYEGVEDCKPGYKTKCECEFDTHDFHISYAHEGCGIKESDKRCTICNARCSNHPEDGLCPDCYKKMKKKDYFTEI